MSDHTDTTLTDTEREQAIIDTARAMHTCTSHPDYPEYDEVPCGGQAEAHCDMGHEHGSRGVCWCCEPLAAAVVDDVLAPIVAARVAAARANERARMANELSDFMDNCIDPDVPREKWSVGFTRYIVGLERARALIEGADQ